MKRRELIRNLALTTATIALDQIAAEAKPSEKQINKKRVLRIAHVTDVHIRPEYEAQKRFKLCIAAIKKHQPDFFLNGGDTIYAADYKHITRERVQEQWNIWHDCRRQFSEYEIYSCLGNHDMWWAAPDKQDAMYGKDHVVRELGIPHRYYSFDKKGWHFIILDSNNNNAGSLDEEQRRWLENDLAKTSADTPVLVLSHYPLLAACTQIDGGGMHTDFKYLADLFNAHKNKIKVCLSGHVHLKDEVLYNDVRYFCNGALSGFWWEAGDAGSAAKGFYKQTAPGYAIIDLFSDGTVQNEYIPHAY